MRKLVKLLVSLFILYLAVQFCYRIFSKGYEIEYEINNDYIFKITEKRVQNTKNEKNNYYFEISINDDIFSFQTYFKFKSADKIINDIKYYEDEQYKCILPVAKNNILFTDIICKRENKFYPYNTIKGTDSNLDEFVDNLSVYDFNKYIESDQILKDNENVITYDNIPSNFYLSLESYKGVYNINSKIVFGINCLFEKDIYTKDISAFVKNYYVVADYNNDYEFHDFYLIDVQNGNKTKITSNKSISMYSYINGVINNSIYLFDTSSKKQYEINIKTKTVIEVGNEEVGIKYYNRGTWETKSVYDAINNKIYFNYYEVDSNFNGQNYIKVDKYGNEKSGYYYLYEITSEGYNIYRVNIQNLNNITYLFTTSNIDNIIYIDDYIIYKDKSYIKYYNDLTGNHKLVKYDEINFNNSLKFGVYMK